MVVPPPQWWLAFVLYVGSIAVSGTILFVAVTKLYRHYSSGRLDGHAEPPDSRSRRR
jgi:hypothetical protein